MDDLPIKIDISSKTATVLIKKILSAVGIIYEPHRIKRLAKAQAQVAKIEAVSKIELSDLERRLE